MPLLVSRRRLEKLKKLPRARGRWMLDSSGFTELSLYGKWALPVAQYVAEVRRYVECVGGLAHAAPQDWMVEPWIVQGTGLSVEEHQRRTLENYLELTARAPDLPWFPVLQGWGVTDYWRHAEAYEKAGVDLAALPLVGVGSVCRRQGSVGAAVILGTLASMRLRLHAFGLKTKGLLLAAGYVASADSLAWSYTARRRPPLPECAGRHGHCNNCLTYAVRWRRRLLHALDADEPEREGPPVQPRLF